MKADKQIIKLFLLGVLALLLFNFPFLSLSGQLSLFHGIPKLYLYVFGLWLVLVLLVYIIVEDRPDKKNNQETHE